jgi:hypothetical protein
LFSLAATLALRGIRRHREAHRMPRT